MVNLSYVVEIFELFCNYEKHYYIGQKQGILQ